MFSIRTILHPTDFSDEADAAFDLACSLARQHDAEVVVLHVLPPSLTFGEFANLVSAGELDEQVMNEDLLPIQSPEPGVRVSHQLERGDPAELILSVAQDLGCDLIVMGTHGRSGLARLFMGSVAEEVLRTAPCPVLTFRPSSLPHDPAEQPRDEAALANAPR
jgi:nucleotide-binding universal stress UspA family protein